MVERGQDPNQVNAAGWTGLRGAVFARPDDNGPHSQVVSFLAGCTDAKIADVKGGLLAIHEAARLGKAGFVAILDAADRATVTMCTTAGLQPLHYAVQPEPILALATTRFLLDLKWPNGQRVVDPACRTGDLNDALHYLGAVASERAHRLRTAPLDDPYESQLWDLLLDRGVDDQLKNREGHSAIGKLYKHEFVAWEDRSKRSNVDWVQPPNDVELLQIVMGCPEYDAKEMHDEMAEQNPKTWPRHLLAFREFCQTRLVERDYMDAESDSDPDGHEHGRRRQRF